MTRAERKRHRREVIQGAAAELHSQIDNGAWWLFPDEDPRVPELSEEVRAYRTLVLERLVESIEKRAGGEKCPHGNDLIPGEDASCGCRG